ncbi:Uncharacterized protein HDE_13353 [Halotydeus destructor]|nr:Uncharacterized protein HDE_13353 [Halotydeus destructor]
MSLRNSLLGNFEESLLNGRLKPASTVAGFKADIGASGSFYPDHLKVPVTVHFYAIHNRNQLTSPYVAHIDLDQGKYRIPSKGVVQVTLFNSLGSAVKIFLVPYNLSEMPPNSQTFIRQRTLFLPRDASEKDVRSTKFLRYLIHLRFMSSKSGKIYLHKDIKAIIYYKCDLDAAAMSDESQFEMRTFIQSPDEPSFSSRTRISCNG